MRCTRRALRPALGGLLAFDGIELLEHLDRDGQVIVFKFEDRLRVVQQDVRIENVSLSPNFNVTLRWLLDHSGSVFHRVDNL